MLVRLQLHGPPPAFAWAYNEVLGHPYDPDKARELLAAAGAEGAELTFVTEGGSGMLDPVAMGTAIQADLQAVGLKVKQRLTSGMLSSVLLIQVLKERQIWLEWHG